MHIAYTLYNIVMFMKNDIVRRSEQTFRSRDESQPLAVFSFRDERTPHGFSRLTRVKTADRDETFSTLELINFTPTLKISWPWPKWPLTCDLILEPMFGRNRDWACRLTLSACFWSFCGFKHWNMWNDVVPMHYGGCQGHVRSGQGHWPLMTLVHFLEFYMFLG